MACTVGKVNKPKCFMTILRGLTAAPGLIVVFLANPFQPKVQSQTTGTYQFEVASIRPNNSGLFAETGMRADSGRLTASNLPLDMLIQRAYGIKGFQISGGPNWLNMDRYDVAAKASENVGPEQLMLMLQTLLADRFKLKIHREMRNLSSYVMVVAKNGPKLQKAKEDEQAKPIQLNPQRLTGTKVPVSRLATVLSNVLGRPVLDRTELGGDFDFYMDWTPDPGVAPSSPGFFDPLLTLIEDRLGLKLEPRKGPVEILVVDSAERPSEN